MVLISINAIKTTTRSRCIYSSVIFMYGSTCYVGIGQVKMAASTCIRMGAALRKPQQSGTKLVTDKKRCLCSEKIPQEFRYPTQKLRNANLKISILILLSSFSSSSSSSLVITHKLKNRRTDMNALHVKRILYYWGGVFLVSASCNL